MSSTYRRYVVSRPRWKTNPVFNLASTKPYESKKTVKRRTKLGACLRPYRGRLSLQTMSGCVGSTKPTS
jgi:hypothetical protein